MDTIFPLSVLATEGMRGGIRPGARAPGPTSERSEVFGPSGRMADRRDHADGRDALVQREPAGERIGRGECVRAGALGEMRQAKLKYPI